MKNLVKHRFGVASEWQALKTEETMCLSMWRIQVAANASLRLTVNRSCFSKSAPSMRVLYAIRQAKAYIKNPQEPKPMYAHIYIYICIYLLMTREMSREIHCCLLKSPARYVDDSWDTAWDTLMIPERKPAIYWRLLMSLLRYIDGPWGGCWDIRMTHEVTLKMYWWFLAWLLRYIDDFWSDS